VIETTRRIAYFSLLMEGQFQQLLNDETGAVQLGHLSLVTEKRKPFDILAERPSIQLSRGNCRIFEPFAALVERFVRSYPVPPAPYLRDAAQLGRRSA
jgi:hypothetical protein